MIRAIRHSPILPTPSTRFSVVSVGNVVINEIKAEIRALLLVYSIILYNMYDTLSRILGRLCD